MFTKLPIDTIYSIVEVATGVAGFAIALYTVRRNRLAAICFGSLGAAIAVLCFLLSWNAPRPHIIYFPKAVDRQTVLNALPATGLPFECRSAVVADTPTNMIWAGDSVSLNDVKSVALTLLRSGVRIKGIRRMLKGGDTKATLIEVGAYTDLDGAPTLTVNAVRNLLEIERDTPES